MRLSTSCKVVRSCWISSRDSASCTCVCSSDLVSRSIFPANSGEFSELAGGAPDCAHAAVQNSNKAHDRRRLASYRRDLMQTTLLRCRNVVTIAKTRCTRSSVRSQSNGVRGQCCDFENYALVKNKAPLPRLL